jgi:hypothetical protein
MHGNRFLVLILSIFLVGCVYGTESIEKKESAYAPVEMSLCQINQKVASHYLVSGIPDGFNEAQYKAAVNEVCHSNPECLSKAKEIFDSYGVDARKVDDMFTVMLCDKEMKWKIMEDFSCDNLKVEVHSWQEPDKVPCEFELDWERIKREKCKD